MRRHGAEEAAPHARAADRIEPHADHAGKMLMTTSPYQVLAALRDGDEARRRRVQRPAEEHSTVRTMHTSTVRWMEIFSKRQARSDLLERWRQGSPKVLARPPQPHTQEQYQRLPKKIARTGTSTREPRKL